MSSSVSDPDFEAALALSARRVDATLDGLLGPGLLPGEIHRPPQLLAAIRHGVLNGGKRLRPFFLAESAKLFGVAGVAIDRVAAALECIHCYSLIHDDLPAMDDDDLRRGRPTVHRAFDEATAILAGDSLLTFAFDILADEATELPCDRKVMLVRMLARAAGMGGMAGGQALDLAAETSSPDETGIVMLQSMKTGALIRFACEAGAVAAGAATWERERLADFGACIGLAFQLADDLLDLTADAGTLGKATGKDAAAGKATLAGLHGEEWSRAELRRLVDEATELLAPFGSSANRMRATARFVADRRT